MLAQLSDVKRRRRDWSTLLAARRALSELARAKTDDAGVPDSFCCAFFDLRFRIRGTFYSSPGTEK